jgi:hypothetical protein
MADRPFRFLPILGLSIALTCFVPTFAQEKPAPDGPKPEAAPPAPAPKPAEHEMLLKDAKRVEGLIPLYRTETKLFAELGGNHYADEYLVLISIARGIGQGMLLGGMTWGFGDEWVWQFRKVDKSVHVIRRNIRFKADKGTPESTAVRNAYTDSVLFSLPIATKGPNGGDLVELSQIFMSDLPQISNYLPGFMFAANRSTYDSVKGFKDNVELQVAATYASGGQVNFDTVPDSRGVTITVHYSISKIPSTGYKPRVADDRVGYFLTVVKDFSKKDAEDQFVRFINRWHLQKADPSLERSPPKEHLVFYIEKTVPFKHRQPIREGILEWNKAFEKAGFDNAIEVKQQTDEDDWDPEDINYNTFRWITSNAGFAMGPSRVNPYTGQILDADVILDADFVTFWKQEFETLTAESIAAMTGGVPEQLPNASPLAGNAIFSAGSPYRHCLLSQGMARQFAFGATAIMAEADPKKAAEMEEKLIMQGLKEVTMHEVGHTLGLRHNFKGSTQLSLKDLNDVAKTREVGMVASVMDYNPTNIVPKGTPQGDYYPTSIGPYDYWAIEYGYKQFSGSEEEELKKVAARSGEPALKYATDEDTRGIVDPDPEANRFDLGSDSLEFAKQRVQLMKELVPGLVDKAVKDGEDYTKARKAFYVVLDQYGESMYFASRYVGGLHTSRSHKGDKDGKPPFAVVDVNKQRESLKLLEENVFSDKPFDFPPALYNHLASTNWSHWGIREPRRKDMAVHELIVMWQEQILEQLLSPVTLERIHDTEMKVPADQDALTSAELLDRLSKAIFAELRSTPEAGNFTERKPAISSLRRNLQRSYFKTVANIALGRTGAPQDCQTVAYAQLAGLKEEIDKLLASKAKLDAYTSAHLKETSSRIDRVLKADFNVGTP